MRLSKKFLAGTISAVMLLGAPSAMAASSAQTGYSKPGGIVASVTARFRPDAPAEGKTRGAPQRSVPLKFVRVEPYIVPKTSLTGANAERVDTRVLQVIFAIDMPNAPVHVGQQLDVFIDVGSAREVVRPASYPQT